MALKLGIQTYQILTNDDEVCIQSLSSILLAVKALLEILVLRRDNRKRNGQSKFEIQNPFQDLCLLLKNFLEPAMFCHLAVLI